MDSGPTLGPARHNIRHCQAPDEITGQRIAAMSHRIGFDEARLSFVPEMSADGNLGF